MAFPGARHQLTTTIDINIDRSVGIGCRPIILSVIVPEAASATAGSSVERRVDVMAALGYRFR